MPEIKQVWISEEMHRALKVASALQGRPMGEIVDEALRPILAPYFSPRTVDESTESVRLPDGVPAGVPGP